ncbi:MAG: glutaredoxin family protein [Candidatus Hodarchaeota archaeon]
MLEIEIYHTPACGNCRRTKRLVEFVVSKRYPKEVKIRNIDLSDPRNIEEARAKGVYGVPTVIIGETIIRGIPRGESEIVELIEKYKEC